MHLAALKQKAASNASKDVLFQEMMNISALNPTALSLEKLATCKCLPVRQGSSGEVVLMNKFAEFAIVDRLEYGDMFDRKISILDLSLEQVHSVAPFLQAIAINDRYLSKLVKEETRVRNGSLDQRLTNDLRNKGYAICRYATNSLI
jgi:hypothetical protein